MSHTGKKVSHTGKQIFRCRGLGAPARGIGGWDEGEGVVLSLLRKPGIA